MTDPYFQMKTRKLNPRNKLAVVVIPAVLRRLHKNRNAYPADTVFLAYKFSSVRGISACQKSKKPHLRHSTGAELKVETCHVSTLRDCGAGVNIATLRWCMTNTSLAPNQLLKLWLVAFKASDIACLPREHGHQCSKFRVYRCEIVMQVRGVRGFE